MLAGPSLYSVISNLQNYFFLVHVGKMVLKNVTSSEYPRRTIKFLVESCLPDVVVQFFRGPELLDSTTDPVEKGWLGTLQFKQGDIKSGDYACQAISDSANMVLQEFFSL